MMASITKSKKNMLIQGLTIVGLIYGWYALSTQYPSILVPSPLETWEAMRTMLSSGEFFEQLMLSINRMAVGFLIGMMISVCLGLLAGRFDWIYEMFRPILSIIMGVPSIILVVLAMVWFGTGPMIPIFVVAILVFPIFFLNTANGWKEIDQQLIEMAAIYHCGSFHILKHIILPGLAVPLFTAISLAAGNAVRITIMAELLGSDTGIGASLALARVNINTDKVFAWTILSILLILVIDHLIINPLKKYSLKWNRKEEA